MRGGVGCPAAPLAMGSVTCRGLRRLRMNEMRRTRGRVGYPSTSSNGQRNVL